MSMITGEVQAKAKTGKSIMVNDVWYGAFASATLDGVNKGDTVTFESVLDKTGKYNNIKGKVEKGGGTAAAPTADGAFKVLKPSLDRDRCIIRQNALTNARELYCAIEEYSSMTAPSVIIGIAREFEAYTSGDLDLAVANEALTKMEVE